MSSSSTILSGYHSSITLMGRVETDSINLGEGSFSVRLLTKESLKITVSKATQYEVLRNVGNDDRDRVEKTNAQSPADEQCSTPQCLDKYIKAELMICVEGVYSERRENDDAVAIVSARRIVLMHSKADRYGWEDTHWWLQQINTLFEQWLDTLFGSKRVITENDFSQSYRTYLNLLGGTTDDETQECATLSRFLYGLSSAYLLTGNERALNAAKSCANYLISAYSSSSHNGKYIFWKFGRVKSGNSTKEIIASQNPDDKGTFALYEQIYALSGLSQYYRITQDTHILSFIVRTIETFQDFYLDEEGHGRNPSDPCFTGKGGYFSHIDPITMRPDSPSLDKTDNREKKNWNSIGDHIPAYLVNLLLSIDPLPKSESAVSASGGVDVTEFWSKLRTLCRSILDNCVDNIINHFPDPEDNNFVYERFQRDWKPDITWGWQQDCGIVGHNLKISWNLTRCGHYYTRIVESIEKSEKSGEKHELKEKKKDYTEKAEKCYELSQDIGNKMKRVGVDLIRGGIFDALERNPKNGMMTEFVWGSTKDFWQQEQAILAYYIMHGISDKKESGDTEFLELARYCAAFWNLFFIDQDNRKIFFRTTESGEPVIESGYGLQGGHAIAGYHAFELNYLAHIYIRTFVDRGQDRSDTFVLYYRPEKSGITSLNVMPDFMRSEDLKIVEYRVNNDVKHVSDSEQLTFQISLEDIPENSEIMVKYLPVRLESAKTLEETQRQGKTLVDGLPSNSPTKAQDLIEKNS